MAANVKLSRIFLFVFFLLVIDFYLGVGMALGMQVAYTSNLVLVFLPCYKSELDIIMFSVARVKNLFSYFNI